VHQQCSSRTLHRRFQPPNQFLLIIQADHHAPLNNLGTPNAGPLHQLV
jgi:hypothetical protein